MDCLTSEPLCFLENEQVGKVSTVPGRRDSLRLKCELPILPREQLLHFPAQVPALPHGTSCGWNPVSSSFTISHPFLPLCGCLCSENHRHPVATLLGTMGSPAQTDHFSRHSGTYGCFLRGSLQSARASDEVHSEFIWVLATSPKVCLLLPFFFFFFPFQPQRTHFPVTRDYIELLVIAFTLSSLEMSSATSLP